MVPVREVLAQLGRRDSQHVRRRLEHPRLRRLAPVDSAVAALFFEGNLNGLKKNGKNRKPGKQKR